VQGPPVYVNVKVAAILEEESTSVFVPNDESVREKTDITPPIQKASHVVDPGVMTKVRYLSEPFQKQVYTPLQFILEDGIVKGEIQKLENDILWIETDDEITELEIGKIEDVLWRGHPFKERA
jgi:hypothetical protein